MKTLDIKHPRHPSVDCINALRPAANSCSRGKYNSCYCVMLLRAQVCSHAIIVKKYMSSTSYDTTTPRGHEYECAGSGDIIQYQHWFWICDRMLFVTSFSCSLRWRYWRFCESSKLVSSFFCWPSMCCWNFFSSARAALVCRRTQTPSVPIVIQQQLPSMLT